MPAKRTRISNDHSCDRRKITNILIQLNYDAENIVQGFSGWLSDKLQKKKSLALPGYLLSVAKVLAST
jgi:hypothetical protein